MVFSLFFCDFNYVSVRITYQECFVKTELPIRFGTTPRIPKLC